MVTRRSDARSSTRRASRRQSHSSSARACRAALRPTMQPRAAHLDPRDAYCSRNPPPPHHPYHAMRPRSRRERLHPPRPRTACLLPLAGTAAAIEEAARRVRCCPFPTLVPRDRPPFLLARERPALACSPIAARLQSERRGRERARRRPRLDAHAADVLPVGSALLSRSLFPFSCIHFCVFVQPPSLISFYLCRRGSRAWGG